MDLKKAIVIVSEFSMKHGANSGTRGGSPGDYIKRYLARDKATETCAFVKRFDSDDYTLRYMARDSATESILDPRKVKSRIKKTEKYGGVAFGKHRGISTVSLSDEKLRIISNDIQKCFDNEKTVIKTVLSFDQEYLRETGIIEPDFKCINRGDYRGNIDQMKLRLAIMQGLERMESDYDNLNYVGVIQVDTSHVHCHLAMVDMGAGKIHKSSGRQNGRLNKKAMQRLRRGIDASLDENKSIAFMKSSVDYDRRNTALFVRRAAYRAMQKNGIGQFLLACLPKNPNMWHADVNAPEMKKANSVAREYVKACLSRPESGYSSTQDKTKEYADFRRDREGLSVEKHSSLIKNGEKQVEDDCINSIYSTLRTVRKSQKQIRTPMLDVMSMPIENIRGDDSLSVFAYNLRSYSARILHANDSRDKAHEIVKDYEKALRSGDDVEQSQPVYEFFKFEEEYQEKILSKYRHFLTFFPPTERYKKEYDELLAFRQQCIDINNMLNDSTIKHFKYQDKAEEYGLRVYNHRGGSFMLFAPEMIEQRRDRMFDELEVKYDELSYKLARDGLILEDDANDDNIPKIRRGVKHKFQDVKALDLHHLKYDKNSDARISKNCLEAYLQVTAQRAALMEQAKLYLEATEQYDALKNLPTQDVKLMEDTARQLAPQVNPALPNLQKEETENISQFSTTRLDYEFTIDEIVNRALENFDDLEDLEY